MTKPATLIGDLNAIQAALNSIRDAAWNHELTVGDLCEAAHETAKAKGWWPHGRSVLECLALVHSEVSEAVEAYRDGVLGMNIRDDGKPEGMVVELADVCIRIFDMCANYNLDLERAIMRKMEFNNTRPFRHGGKQA